MGQAIASMSFSSQLIPWYREAQVYLSTTLAHPAWLPFPILDILGAIRLSVFIDQIVRQENGITRADGNVEEERKRPSFLQEAFGISVLVFGGETFLGGLGSIVTCKSLTTRLIARWFALTYSSLSRHHAIVAGLAQRLTAIQCHSQVLLDYCLAAYRLLTIRNPSTQTTLSPEHPFTDSSHEQPVSPMNSLCPSTTRWDERSS